jgi:hypothetical protein
LTVLPQARDPRLFAFPLLQFRNALLLALPAILMAGALPHSISYADQPTTQLRELRKLHALLIIATRSGLGESVVIDGKHIQGVSAGDLRTKLLLNGKFVSTTNGCG